MSQYGKHHTAVTEVKLLSVPERLMLASQLACLAVAKLVWELDVSDLATFSDSTYQTRLLTLCLCQGKGYLFSVQELRRASILNAKPNNH